MKMILYYGGLSLIGRNWKREKFYLNDGLLFDRLFSFYWSKECKDEEIKKLIKMLGR